MSIYNFTAPITASSEKSLEEFKGKVLLIVNTASACGFTPQYAELQELYDKYSDKGLEILAFPCNQFGAQEKGSDSEIKSFCDLKFNVKFPIFSKVNVNGDDAIELYKYLKEQKPGLMGSKKIKWNFTKFLVDREGNPYKRYAPVVKPKSMVSDIEKLLG